MNTLSPTACPSSCCATCGAADGCLCRLSGGDEQARPRQERTERERDFSDEPLGKRVRTPPGYVEACACCGAAGVYLRIPGKRGRRPAIDQWIHVAMVGPAGYGVLAGCERPIEPTRKRKRA